MEKLIQRARAAVACAERLPDVIAVAEEMRKCGQHELARGLLNPVIYAEECEDDEFRIRFHKERALALYKDPKLSDDLKLDGALEIIRSVADLATVQDADLLGVAGAIHKRLWEATGRKQELEAALACYRRGWELRDASDRHYPGINAAFIYDLLADMEDRAAKEFGASNPLAEGHREEARKIREEVVTFGIGDDKWKALSRAEAYVGLGNWKRAKKVLEQVAERPDLKLWEQETAMRQMARLIRIRHPELTIDELCISPAGQAVAVLMKGNAAALESAFVGKIGLALSGGGFRASLFHIGMLARMAELDILRHLHCISCVSGGSIIGAYYFLELRKMLLDNPEPAREQYIQLVRRVAKKFLEGVRTNIRTRVLASPSAMWAIVAGKRSRTSYLGELYERLLFSKIADGGENEPRLVTQLAVEFQGGKPFVPQDENWTRAHKVPVLILNATTLNTGHNWQFTGSWMGEPAASIDAAVDANYRLGRLHYNQLPDTTKPPRLGDAVAASSCVPGLFEALPLHGLYGGKTVQLVDGGVHDNQGAAGLLEQGCSYILVSDASGQMGVDDNPKTGIVADLCRTNEILQARLRSAQYRELHARHRGGLLQGLVFLHLKMDLGDVEGTDGLHTGYGVLTEVQNLLADVRTDLDSFSDLEAYALMNDGYRMAEHAFSQVSSLPYSSDTTGDQGDWPFRAVDPLMTDPQRAQPLVRHLRHSNRKFFRLFARWRVTSMALIGVLSAFGLGLAWPLVPWQILAILAACALAIGLAWRRLRPMVWAILLPFFAHLHLQVVDRLTLVDGRVPRTSKRQGR